MYKKLIEQHTKNKAGLLWYTPFILSSKRKKRKTGKKKENEETKEQRKAELGAWLVAEKGAMA